MSTHSSEHDSRPADPVDAAASAANDAAAGAERKVETELEDLSLRCLELEQKLLKAAADYQNFVRRSHQSVAAAREQQTADVARDLVAVMDHFDTALAVDADKATARSLLDGLVMVRDELLRALERHGVKRLTAARGDEFNPNFHEALMRQKAADVKTNHVVSQLQPGYLIRDRTLRPAKVIVAE